MYLVIDRQGTAIVQEYDFTGKYEDNIPIVWRYYDQNGECSKWVRSRIDRVTFGKILKWGTNEWEIREYAAKYNGKDTIL